MTDEERCNALVEAGILVDCGWGEYDLAAESDPFGFSADKILSDWRVAGACLERFKAEDLPRAIIETFVAHILREVPNGSQ